MKHELLLAVALLFAISLGLASAATQNPCAGLPDDQCAFVSSGDLPAYAQASIEAEAEGDIAACGPILILSSGNATDDDNTLSTALGNSGCGPNPDGFSTNDCVDLQEFSAAQDSIVMAFSSEWEEFLDSTFTDWMFVSSENVTRDLSLNGWDQDQVTTLENFGPDEAGAIALASIGAETPVDLRVADSGDSIYDSALIVAPRTCFGEQDVGTQFCGNGEIDPGEQCEVGLNLTSTCVERGFASGTLACNPQTCQFDVSACVADTPGDDNQTGENETDEPVETTQVQIMKHICNEDVRTLDDFEALGSFVNKVVACPTTTLPGDEPTDGVSGESSEFEFAVTHGDDDTVALDDAAFVPQKLCETDIGMDVNEDGNISADTCLDTSLYALDNITEGIVEVVETQAPADTRFGALEFTPQAVVENTDAQALIEVDQEAASILLNTSMDADDAITLHIYNFMVDEPDEPVDNGTNQTACFTSLKSLPVTCDGGEVVMDTTTSCRHVTCSSEDASLQVMACPKPDGADQPEYFEMYHQQGSGSGLEVCIGNTCLEQDEQVATAGYAQSEQFPVCVEGFEPQADSCIQAIENGQLTGQIYADGTSVIWNDADEDFEVGAAVYKQLAFQDIEGQQLHDSATGVVPANGNISFELDAPVCAWQYEVFCGDDVIEDLSQEFYNDRKIYFEYSQDLPYCVEQEQACTASVTLTGEKEVPSVDSNALGTAAVKLSEDELVVEGGVVFLQSELNSIGGSPGHVHFGEADENGPVVWNLNFNPEEDADAATFSLVQGISEEQRTQLVDGEYYLNIHSELYPAGVVRGQIEFDQSCSFATTLEQ